ncbi:glycoside hydrolase domain-containing protein [Streptomyces sp. NPDC057540]|uniref:glycoside hydrolase domain-containing protein n=1 Tax=Streptomyces sp. NPDC057540 TaxID=3346160 RepID=UPI0036A3A935
MADEMVLRAQRFINLTYADGAMLGLSKLAEDGRTGWTTMYALTRALQYEMGITALSNSFGPTTLSTLQTKYGQLDETTVPSANFCRVVQSALYCKGYDGGDIDGTYNSRVKAAVAKLKDQMGVAYAFPGTSLQPKVVKGLFNMDAYVSVGDGTDSVRAIQRWLNGQYVQRKDFFIIPCDGHHSRDVAKSMLFAIQYELGMADGTANGAFGPGTQAGLKSHTVSVGSSGVWVQLFTAAMELNRRHTGFTSTFTESTAVSVRSFQEFMALDMTGQGDFRTWASLLVSYGDQTRQGTACDGVTKITPARAQALKNAGYKYIGRYLYNASTTSLPEKEIQPGELETIQAYGLRCFPIYQTWARSVDYYSTKQGESDCMMAVYKAQEHGFKNGARIYFAVDYDAVDDEVTSNVLPYFQSVRAMMTRLGSPYKIGIYGPRNVCSRVVEKNHADSCFVSDMSSGFSGNLGYPMPDKWAFGQIVTKTVGSGDGLIEIDNNIATGWDTGQGEFLSRPSLKQDTGFSLTYWDALLAEIQAYMESIGRPVGERIYTRQQCLETVIMNDATITAGARMFRMRKALIQTSAFWEFCHYSVKDYAEDAGVTAYHTGAVPDWAKDLPFVERLVDSSTGIAKISGRTCILSRNNAIDSGLLEGERLDSTKDADRWAMWQKLNQDHAFNLSTVPYLHIWGADGKKGDLVEEPPIRRPALDYSDTETYEILRRYQGSEEPAFSDAQMRMPLYAIFEKYNRVIRES